MGELSEGESAHSPSDARQCSVLRTQFLYPIFCNTYNDRGFAPEILLYLSSSNVFMDRTIMTVVTRFAPSPTGTLHIGGARTALYCWLYARKTHGKFILRIEDTDTERSTQASTAAILDAMTWLGLHYDEGPYYQMDRLARYRAVIEQLLATGHAYRCYCSKERLDEMRTAQMAAKKKPRYDGRCRAGGVPTGVDPTAPHVIRFANPQSGEVVFEDLVRGQLVFANQELDDLVLIRTDGIPTYNFGVVIDDWDMGITHVVRGDDHINNTPRQINILRALGASPPHYAHVSMILGKDGKRLSKRHGAVGVMQFREEGYLPEALLNCLVRLGWSHGDQEIFSITEMIQHFEIAHLQRAPAAFNAEKLDWLNQHYMKQGDRAKVAAELAWHFERVGIEVKNGPALVDIIDAQAERCKTLVEMVQKSGYFYTDTVTYAAAAVKKNLTADVLPHLAHLRAALAALPQWEKSAIHAVIEQVATTADVKMGKVAQPLRVAVTGDTVSPPIDVTLVLLGKARTLARLDAVLHPDFLEKNHNC